MATNPMQRKARMSLVLGIFLGLLIGGAVIVLLFMKLKGYQDKEKQDLSNMADVYVLNQDVKTGQEVTPNMYSVLKVNKSTVPSDAITSQTKAVIENYRLQDKDGNAVQTKVDNGTAIMYITINNKAYKLINREGTDNYYIEKDGEQVDIELNRVPLRAKVTMAKNTVLTKELVGQGVNSLADDVRREEYNSFLLPMDLATGDFVDVRLMTPSGQNFIVVSKKEVEVPNISGADSVDTVWMNVTEDEILALSGAIVDSYRMEGSKLYVDKYTDAGMQEAATPTYVISDDVATLLKNDPNILDKAKNALAKRYTSDSSVELRKDYINATINKNDNADDDVTTKMQDSIKKSQDSRKQYLDSLSGAVK